MKTQFILLVLVGLALASNFPAWKDSTEYVYLVRGRTLASIHELSDQYSGILLKAKLHVIPRSDNKLQARISDAQYAQIHSQLPDGWNSEIPASKLSWKPWALTDKPFQLVMKKGLIESVIVEKEVSNWEANVIKSIVSQFQLDVQGNNVISSPINNLPEGDSLEGVFKVLEETVTGETETTYEVHRLPEYLVQTQPWLVPQYKRNDEVVEVIKHKNYTNSNEMPLYNYGFGEVVSGQPSDNTMGSFFLRQSTSRAILTGKQSRFLIQTSYTVNKVIVNPTITGQEQGSVVSSMNVTLSKVVTQGQKPSDLSDPINIGSLVYTYESPFAKSNEVRQKNEEKDSDMMHSSESESNERIYRRFRRAADQMIHKMDDSSSSSSSEESTQYQPQPQMNQAPEYPLLPYFMGYHGRSIKNNRDFDLKKNVKSIANEIAEDLKSPEKILTQSTLSKYAMLASLVRVMDEQEIRSVFQQLYTANKQDHKYLAYVAFRDAVAEAGTGPAFLNIQEWIEQGKIQNEEASEVVAQMAYSARVPTEEYMRKFFDLIQKPQVWKQEKLNETALFSYTRLVHRVYIDTEQSHNQYPVNVFKHFDSEEGKQFVKKSVIPYLKQKLQEAVRQADTRKIHAYIRALGNVGHKQILEVFEPYLEGEQQVSQFQRLLMVLSMDKLVNAYPVKARSVLYKIYQNTGETPEVRVAAVHQLMRTNPPVEMLQYMASKTNTDAQEQVNAAVKSAIESASDLQGMEAQQTLQKAAESAKPLLTKKQYGQQMSANFLQDFIIKQMNIEFKQNLLEIASPESNLPKGIKYSIRGNINGIKHYFTNIQALVSSIDELTNVLYKQTDDYQQVQSQSSKQPAGKWSSEKVAESLNLQTNEREQLEGLIYAEMNAIQKLYSFDNETIEQLPQAVREVEEMLKKGKEFNYAKLRQVKEMALSFPTETGLPFLYTYDMPLLVRFEGKIRAQANPQISRNDRLNKPEEIKTEIEAQITVSSKVQSHLCVVTPFDHQVYIAGFDKNIQTHIPVKGEAEVDVQKQQAIIKLEVQESKQDSRLLHYSSWPYTSRSDVMNLNPVALRPNTRRMTPQANTHRSFDFVAGQKQTGLSFRVWGHHPEQSMNLLQLLKAVQIGDLQTVWEQIWDQSSLQQTEASISLLPGQSSTRRIVIRLGYQQDNKQHPENQQQEDFKTMNELSSKTQNREQRKQNLLKHVGSGIRNAELYALDAEVDFEGEREIQHVITAAFAKSNVAPESSIVMTYQSNAPSHSMQGNIQIKGYAPNTNALDLSKSLEKEPQQKYEVFVQYGRSQEEASKVQATVDLSRSQARKKYLKEQPLYQVCKQQMQEQNYQLPACHNMTIESKFLDDVKIKLQYENFQPRFKRAIETLFKGIRFIYFPMTKINEVQSQRQNVIEARVQFQPENLRQVNFTVIAEDEETKIFNISLPQLVKTVVVPHATFDLKARILAEIMGYQDIRPTCMLDHNMAKTFNNRTYPLSLGTGWTVMMQYIPQAARPSSRQHRQQPADQLKDHYENFMIMVREMPSGSRREIMMTFSHPKTEGRTVEVHMRPTESGASPVITVLVDGETLKFDDRNSAKLFDGYLEVYALENDEVKLEIRNWFYMIFDGERIQLSATSDKLRDSIIGLCGRFSDDKYEDFWTPGNCIVRDERKFIQSFKVEGNQQPQQNSAECVPKELPLYVDVVSKYDAEKNRPEHQHAQRNGMRYRTRYFEKDGEICFSTTTVPQCKNGAKSTSYKSVPVHCVEKTKTAFYMKKQIDQGGNPDFSHKTTTKNVQMEIDEHCK